MAMEVYDTLDVIWIVSLGSVFVFFHDRQLWCHLFNFFCIQFFKQRVSITLERALAFTIERKIALVGDVCSRPPITIKSHDFHSDNIREVVGETTSSYHEKD
jgi:hypothetical protein